jgi:hypothetical protein
MRWASLACLGDSQWQFYVIFIFCCSQAYSHFVATCSVACWRYYTCFQYPTKIEERFRSDVTDTSLQCLYWEQYGCSQQFHSIFIPSIHDHPSFFTYNSPIGNLKFDDTLIVQSLCQNSDVIIVIQSKTLHRLN